MDKDPFYFLETTRTNEGDTLLTGFVLWHGLIEDIADPLLSGRVRVRAIGYHNSDRAKMPTDTLPWATPIIPSTGANSNSRLGLGDWVTGYFLDGYDAQKPVILGKFEGINPKNIFYGQNIGGLTGDLLAPPLTTPRNFRELLGQRQPNIDVVLSLTPEQIKILQFQPKPAIGIFPQRGDRPSTPALAQNLVEGTAVAAANKNRVHVCDISGAMRTAAAVARAAFGILMKGIRAAVRAVLTALGFNPESESGRFLQLALVIIRGIKYAQAFIAEINDYAQIFIFYAKKVRAMIDWILSLPKSLAAMLAGCLNELLNSVSAGFSALIGGSVGGELEKSLQVVKDIVESGKKLIDDTTKLLTLPGQIVEALATPASPEAQAAARNTILSFTSGFSTSSNSTSNIQRP